jgi:hypothetical protein
MGTETAITHNTAFRNGSDRAKTGAMDRKAEHGCQQQRYDIDNRIHLSTIVLRQLTRRPTRPTEILKAKSYARAAIDLSQG